VLDLGCGPGRAALALAAELGARVVAVDLHAPFLAELEERARARGLADRIETLREDFARLDLPESAFDLLWSEGAAYVLGFSESLRRWRPFLRRGAHAVVSECVWLVDDPPEEARLFWRDAYPAMASVDDNSAAAAAAGFAVLDALVLPDAAWWDEYYGPLEERLRVSRLDDATRAAAQREIEIRRRFGDAYGYVLFSLRRT
jgi:SAM-dependent methyltransferase